MASGLRYARGKGSHADPSRQGEKTSFSTASRCCFELCQVPRRSHTVLSRCAEVHCTHLRISFDLENTFQSQQEGIGANIQGDDWGFGSMAPLTLVGVSQLNPTHGTESCIYSS